MSVFQNLVRALDKSCDVTKQQQAIGVAFQKIAESLAEIDSEIKNWPVFPTGDDDADKRKLDIRLDDYVKAFAGFSGSVRPSSSQAVYKNLLELREKVAASRKRLIEIRANRAVVWPSTTLEEAKRLRSMFPQLRRLESEFIYSLMHEWRAAISPFVTDLSEAVKQKEADAAKVPGVQPTA